MADEIMKTINEYIQYYTINQPFLSENMIKNLNIIRFEFQDIFESFDKHKSNKTSESLTEFIKAGNMLKGNSLSDIENKILIEMKSDLKIEGFKN